MQKVINVLAVMSFLMSGALVAGVVTAYVHREDIKESAAEEIQGIIEEAVEGAVGDLPDLFDAPSGGMPLPAPGNALPVPF